MNPEHPPNTSSRQPPRTFTPSERWIDAFDKQCTETLLKRALRYAALQAQEAGWELPSASAHDADDVVNHIIKDTLSGVLHWNPDAEGLDQHLFDAIRSRVSRHADRATRYPHVSIDATDSTGKSLVMPEVEAQLAADAPEATLEARERAAATLHSLRALAQRRPLVLRLLSAFEEGATEVADVMHVAGMTLAEYQNARRQLARLVERLPSHLKSHRPLAAKGA
jgi:hypothetical protein